MCFSFYTVVHNDAGQCVLNIKLLAKTFLGLNCQCNERQHAREYQCFCMGQESASEANPVCPHLLCSGLCPRVVQEEIELDSHSLKLKLNVHLLHQLLAMPSVDQT